MIRNLALIAVLLLSACGARDETPMWLPGDRPVPVPETVTDAPAETVPSLSAPRPRPVVRNSIPSTENPPPRYEPAPYEPSTGAPGSGLTDSEARALQGVRQSLDSSINELERRARFDDSTSAEARQLRALKARRRDVVRRLRGG